MQRNSQRGVAKTERDEFAKIINRLSWDDLRIFLACVYEKSFRQAAENLNMSTSSVSRRIDRLEEALEIVLFDRLPEGAALTQDGRSLKENAQRMEQAAFDAIRKGRRYPKEAKGVVKLSVTEGLGAFWVMPQLIELNKQHPFLTLNVQCEMKNSDVLRLEADMAIQFEKPQSPDLIVAKIGRLHLYPFASKKYLDTYGHPQGVEDIPNHRFVLQVASQLDEQVWAEKLGMKNFDDFVGIQTNSSTALYNAIVSGGGIGVLPTYATVLQSPVIPIDAGFHFSMDLWLTYHPSIVKIPHKNLTLNWLKSIFDSQKHEWFKDEFIHPNDLANTMQTSPASSRADGYFTSSQFEL